MTTAAITQLSKRELMALRAFAGVENGYCLSFSGVAGRSELDPKHVRRTVRALARKGLAQYEKGLWSEDGEVAGSGYGLTKQGREILAAVEARNP